MRSVCRESIVTPSKTSKTSGGVIRNLASVSNTEAHVSVKKRARFKLCKKETSLQKWIGQTERVEQKEISKLDEKENMSPNKDHDISNPDLMPPVISMPLLEMGTVPQESIPMNQLELGLEDPLCYNPITDQEWREFRESDSKDYTINSLRKDIKHKDEQIKNLQKSLQEIAKLIPFELYPEYKY